MLYQVQNWPSVKMAQYGCTQAQPEPEPIIWPSMGSQALSQHWTWAWVRRVLMQAHQVPFALAAIKTGYGWVLLCFPPSFLPGTGHVIPLQGRWKLHGCGSPESSSAVLLTYFDTSGAPEVFWNLLKPHGCKACSLSRYVGLCSQGGFLNVVLHSSTCSLPLHLSPWQNWKCAVSCFIHPTKLAASHIVLLHNSWPETQLFT